MYQGEPSDLEEESDDFSDFLPSNHGFSSSAASLISGMQGSSFNDNTVHQQPFDHIEAAMMMQLSGEKLVSLCSQHHVLNARGTKDELVRRIRDKLGVSMTHLK